MLGTVVKVAVAGIAVREGAEQFIELRERRRIFAQARDYAHSLGKPLLVAGSPWRGFTHPCGDVTIDISPRKAEFCGGEIADIRDIPYSDHYFGAALASHILEHLPTIEDACQALDEMHRVADKVFVVSPHKTSIMAWLHPNHHLWIMPSGDGYIIEQRGQRTEKARDKSYIISLSVL